MKSIKDWAEDDRPREKLLSIGAKSLSNAELLAIILGSGSRGSSALDLAKKVLNGVENSFSNMSDLSLSQLKLHKGIGSAKAVTILAALEIGARRTGNEKELVRQIRSSNDAYEVLRRSFYGLPHEEFYVIYLNRANDILASEQISKGGLSGTIADGKVIFRSALSHRASGLILAHNHPSGNLKPSQSDLKLTRSLIAFGKLVDIQILDHLIVSNDNYFSFADEGLMSN